MLKCATNLQVPFPNISLNPRISYLLNKLMELCIKSVVTTAISCIMVKLIERSLLGLKNAKDQFPILTNILKLLSMLNNMTTDLTLEQNRIEQNRTKNVRERLFLEAWYSLKDQNAGNDHIEIPAVYKTLFS